MLFILLFFVAIVDGERLTASGQITCDNIPVPFVKVYAMDEDASSDDEFASTTTNAAGNFAMTGDASDGLFAGTPDPYIKVEYEYNRPLALGVMKVVNELGFIRSERIPTRAYARVIAFGKINFASIHCRAYLQFYNAMVDFKARAKRALPYPVLKVVTKAPIHGGTPYSTTDKIRIPPAYLIITLQTAKHELGHTVRHSLDGDIFHFLFDVGRYFYTRVHTCATRSNFGYAFNEGWAEFWAGECPGVYGRSPKDYKIEGNVAKALRALQAKCGTTDAQMVAVLAANKGKIHSFPCYNLAHQKLYACKL